MRLARRLRYLTRRTLRNACAWVADCADRWDTSYADALNPKDDRP